MVERTSSAKEIGMSQIIMPLDFSGYKNFHEFNQIQAPLVQVQLNHKKFEVKLYSRSVEAYLKLFSKESEDFLFSNLSPFCTN